MPFADYDDFEACVRAHSDKDDPEAYCATIKRQVEGQAEEFDTAELDVLLETADAHTEELVAEFLRAALAEQEARLDQQADDETHIKGPATNSVSWRLEGDEGYCEIEGEVFDWAAIEDGACPQCGEQISDEPTTDAMAEQAEGFAVEVFRIVQAEDTDMDLDGDLMGVGVDFPNAGVYVDWHIEAWPDDDQLDEPHVSDYGTIADLEQATGGVVEPLDTVDAVVDGEVSAAPTDSQSPTE